jgi:hypothetical protein
MGRGAQPGKSWGAERKKGLVIGERVPGLSVGQTDGKKIATGRKEEGGGWVGRGRHEHGGRDENQIGREIT